VQKSDRRWLRILKYALCELHQPFVKMKKCPGFFGWICPKCGNKMGEMWREHQLRKLKMNVSINKLFLNLKYKE